MGKKNKSKREVEKLSREYNKVNMEAAEAIEMPNTDKMKKPGKGSPKNQFK